MVLNGHYGGSLSALFWIFQKFLFFGVFWVKIDLGEGGEGEEWIFFLVGGDFFNFWKKYFFLVGGGAKNFLGVKIFLKKNIFFGERRFFLTFEKKNLFLGGWGAKKFFGEKFFYDFFTITTTTRYYHQQPPRGTFCSPRAHTFLLTHLILILMYILTHLILILCRAFNGLSSLCVFMWYLSEW